MGYEVDYNENNNKPLTHYIKNFLVGFLLIVILLLLLVWIFPTNSTIQKLLNNNKEETTEFSNYFQENINLLKDVAQSYFTLERLPQNEGDTVKITLSEMLEKKLLINLSDDKGKMCNIDDTYVEVTKKKTEYEMKIYLSCGNDEDYVIVYLGCYDYCSNYVCEKKTTSTTTTTSTKTNTKTNTTVTPATKYYCKVVSNKYYDNKGNVVTKSAYEKACENKTPTTKYYCKVVNNKYYDNKGNVVTKSAYETACIKYQYLYEKKVSATYSDWSNWSSDKEYDPNNNNIVWGKQELVWNEKYGYANVTVNKKQYVNDLSKPIYGKDELVKTSLTSKKWTCKNYYYYINQSSGSTLYQASDWTYQGKVQLSYVPTNTDTVKYEYAGFDYDACASNCTLKPVYFFKKYTRTVKNVTTKSKKTLEAECAELEESNVPIYTTVSRVIGYQQKTVTTSTTKKVYYYHTKTRTLKTKAQTYKVWSSSSNDTKLIQQGYKYTGTKQQVK